MNNLECLCVVLFSNSNPLKGRLGVINFYLRGLVVKIFSTYNGKDEKILIKNFSNCFLPEKLLFYLKSSKTIKLNKLKEEIERDMSFLRIKNYILIFERKNIIIEEG